MDIFPITVENDDVYEISPSILDEIDTNGEIWLTGSAFLHEVTPATYLLAEPVGCPHCGDSIRSVHVVGLSGPRSEHRDLVVTCPGCTGSLPPDLVGL